MSHPNETRSRAARALAAELEARGMATLVICEYGLVVLVPLEDCGQWLIWVTAHAVQWRYGPDRADVEQHPHDDAVSAVADRILATMPRPPGVRP